MNKETFVNKLSLSGAMIVILMGLVGTGAVGAASTSDPTKASGPSTVASHDRHDPERQSYERDEGPA